MIFKWASKRMDNHFKKWWNTTVLVGINPTFKESSTGIYRINSDEWLVKKRIDFGTRLGPWTNRLLKTNVTRMKYNLAQLSRADDRSRTKQWYSNTKITWSTNGSTSNLENEKLHRQSLAGYSNVQIAPPATGSPPKKRWKSDSLWRT